jgi:hypothetical protein
VDTDRETCYNNAVLEKSVKQTILEEDADMSDEMKKLSEKQLDAVSGGTTANLVAAYDVLAGKYGEGQDRVNRLSAAGYNYNDVQSLVNALCKGYGPVANDVMNGKYGNGEDRRRRLTAAGFNYDAVQHLVNGLAKGYGPVAADVINGRYGNNQQRINALRAAGYDPYLVQDLVNAMLK